VINDFQLDLASAAPPGPTMLTIGTFDGVHLGHRHLLKSLTVEASRTGCQTVVITFRNHPRSVLRPDLGVGYITSLDERIALLKQTGVTSVIPVDFTKEFAKIRAREFALLLVDILKMRGLVVGPDFAMGYKREGDVPTLIGLGKELGFSVNVAESFSKDAIVIKSSKIRAALSEGDVTGASGMLDRPYSLAGSVVKGDGRGRGLGFPTANLGLDGDSLVLANGIYATWAIVGGRRYLSATNVGTRATFGPGERLVESFLLDFDGDLYGKFLTLEFVKRIRAEECFPTVQGLIDQIKRDVVAIRSILTNQDWS